MLKQICNQSAWHDTDELTQNFLSGLLADVRLKVQCCFRTQAPNNELMEMNSRPLSTIRWTDRTWLQLSAGFDVITLQDFSFLLCIICKCILCFRPGPPYLEFLAGQWERGRMLSYFFFFFLREHSGLLPGIQLTVPRMLGGLGADTASSNHCCCVWISVACYVRGSSLLMSNLFIGGLKYLHLSLSHIDFWNSLRVWQTSKVVFYLYFYRWKKTKPIAI